MTTTDASGETEGAWSGTTGNLVTGFSSATVTLSGATEHVEHLKVNVLV